MATTRDYCRYFKALLIPCEGAITIYGGIDLSYDLRCRVLAELFCWAWSLPPLVIKGLEWVPQSRDPPENNRNMIGTCLPGS